MSKISLETLREEIRKMNRWNDIYKVLKEELLVRGYWRNRQRGNPKKAYEASRKGANK